MSGQNDIEYRRLAVQIASQLPEDRDGARKVVRHLSRLMETFLFVEEPSQAANQPAARNSTGNLRSIRAGRVKVDPQ